MNNSNSSNPMRDQVGSVPELIREQIWKLEAQTRKVLTTPEVFAVRQIIVTGCGDSYISAMTAETVFAELAGIPTRALNAMQASRYHAPSLRLNYPNNPLVLAVSNSGEVARVVEAVKHYTQQGALTLAITGNPESRLAEQASRSVHLTIPPFVSAPGVRSHIVSLLTLYLLAIRMGEVRGQYTADEAMKLRQELEKLAQTIEGTIRATDRILYSLAENWRACPNIEILGSGPDRGTAAYGAAKLLEATGIHAIHQDIEEWVHLQYFVRDAQHTATIIVCPEGSPAFSRVLEIQPLLQRLERPYVVFTSESCAHRFDHAVAVPLNQQSLFAPLVYSMPLALFAAYLSEQLQETYGRGATGQWADCENGMTTRNSAIM